MSDVFEFKNVFKTIKNEKGVKVELLHNVSFTVPRGKATGFIGLNGAGKTTSIKVLLQFLRKDSGVVLYSGSEDFSEGFRSRLGYLPERPYFYEYLTAREFLQLHLALLDQPQKEYEARILAVLTRVDLQSAIDKRLKNFSKGMLQRLGIAQAIINSPEVLLLDEPMSGLDPLGRALLKGIMNEHMAKGGTLFFSSHLLQDMEELCDKAIVIHKGHIRFEGAVSELMGSSNLETAFLSLIGGAVK